MHNSFYILLFIFLLGNVSSIAQTKIEEETIVVTDSIKKSEINPLAPAKAAFYSAIVPGMGQVYNKKYWKVPIVYAAMGTSIYFYVRNNNLYHDYRDTYKQRLQGFTDDKYSYLDNSRLIEAQKFYQKNRDLSAILTGIFYVLNIVDANVDAHLMQFNVNEKLAIKPDLYQNDFTAKQNVGICLMYKL